MVEKCKFCGAEPDSGMFESFFKCSTLRGYTVRGADCLAQSARIYEEALPIRPDCEDPLTPEICERLGMQDNGNGMWVVSNIEGFPVVYFSTHEPPKSQIYLNHFTIHDMTAGQLSLLVAFANARESQHEKGKTPA